MNDLTPEKYLHLYECVVEVATSLEFDTFNRIYYCGTRLKWTTPNALLIVIEDNPYNRFYEEMACEDGACGTNYLVKPLGPGGPYSIANKHNTFHYKVIAQTVYDALNNDWDRIADESWIYPKNMEYIPGIEITDQIIKYHNLAAFI
jgi:hypothetical protein